MDEQVEEGDSAPLVHSHETRPGVLNPAVGSSGPVGSSPEEGHKGLEHLSYEERLRE